MDVYVCMSNMTASALIAYSYSESYPCLDEFKESGGVKFSSRFKHG